MIRQICNLCQKVEVTAIRNLRKYSLSAAWRQNSILMYPEVEEDDTQEINNNDTIKPIIQCKRKLFNFYPGKTYRKFEDMPIASGSWHNAKSKGDYFTIYPTLEEEQEEEAELRIKSFDDLYINKGLIENLKFNNIEEPTLIQKRGIPEILNGQNIFVTAETGCGKTLTYLLPVMNQILKWKELVQDRPHNSPLALILTPSRELAHQIGTEAKKLSINLGINVKTLSGGKTKKLMRNPSVRDVDILIGTIGVISKLTTVKIYKLNYVRHTVIDEAHALFDETFEDKMKCFLKRIKFGFEQVGNNFPESSQLTLASATLPKTMPEYLNKCVNMDSIIQISTANTHRVLVPQKFMRLGGSQKAPMLLKLVKPRALRREPTLIFSNDSSTCDFISIFLNQMNIKATNLHGSIPTEVRNGKYRAFKNGEISVLSTTNAGARGLDTIMVDFIINYDFPLSTVEYIHRCGRTGRVGGKINGRVINFISKPLEIEMTKKIERITRRMQPLPMFDITEQRAKREMDNEIKQLMAQS
ncbi:probable ATP-dependent RNA helicase DDX28 [Microplitis demolitor]|uniref:probable ATP-dependent RNA helicase DDX28 n=1 Tax=Microplitis demolitor TaxID=69319 RepID=UPI0004CD7C9C|nr:probable ATP-dependent RNA helicase DDX28 [Microplitis demolitor]